MVTHLFQLARKLSEEAPAGLVSLVAERKEDGTRTFHMVPGAPSHTSYGIELFESMIKNS